MIVLFLFLHLKLNFNYGKVEYKYYNKIKNKLVIQTQLGGRTR